MKRQTDDDSLGDKLVTTVDRLFQSFAWDNVHHCRLKPESGPAGPGNAAATQPREIMSVGPERQSESPHPGANPGVAAGRGSGSSYYSFTQPPLAKRASGPAPAAAVCKR